MPERPGKASRDRAGPVVSARGPGYDEAMRTLPPSLTGAPGALRLARWLLAVILAVTLPVAALAWLNGATVLAGLALVIAAEETLEITTVIRALRRDPGMRPAA